MVTLKEKFQKLYPHLNYDDFKHSTIWICLENTDLNQIDYNIENQIDKNDQKISYYEEKPGPVG